MSRYDLERFDPVPDPDLMCCICHCVLDDPKESPCRHVFCRVCIQTWLRRHRNCPTCRKRISEDDLQSVLPIVQNMINRLKMKCEYDVNGCMEKLQLEHYDNHIQLCGFKMCKCKYTRCGREVLRRDLGQHEAEECTFRETQCQLQCGLMILVTSLQEHSCLQALKNRVKEYQEELQQLKQTCAELKKENDDLSKKLRSSDHALDNERGEHSNTSDNWSVFTSSDWVMSDSDSHMTEYTVDHLSDQSDREDLDRDGRQVNGSTANREAIDINGNNDGDNTARRSDDSGNMSARSPAPSYSSSVYSRLSDLHSDVSRTRGFSRSGSSDNASNYDTCPSDSSPSDLVNNSENRPASERSGSREDESDISYSEEESYGSEQWGYSFPSDNSSDSGDDDSSWSHKDDDSQQSVDNHSRVSEHGDSDRNSIVHSSAGHSDSNHSDSDKGDVNGMENDDWYHGDDHDETVSSSQEHHSDNSDSYHENYGDHDQNDNNHEGSEITHDVWDAHDSPHADNFDIDLVDSNVSDIDNTDDDNHDSDHSDHGESHHESSTDRNSEHEFDSDTDADSKEDSPEFHKEEYDSDCEGNDETVNKSMEDTDGEESAQSEDHTGYDSDDCAVIGDSVDNAMPDCDNINVALSPLATDASAEDATLTELDLHEELLELERDNLIHASLSTDLINPNSNNAVILTRTKKRKLNQEDEGKYRKLRKL